MVVYVVYKLHVDTSNLEKTDLEPTIKLATDIKEEAYLKLDVLRDDFKVNMHHKYSVIRSKCDGFSYTDNRAIIGYVGILPIRKC